MNYSDWLASFATILNMADANATAALTAMAPRAIEYAEGRMYRDPDLDFLATRAVDITKRTASGLRSVTIPTSVTVAGFSGTFVVIEGVSIITPAGQVPSNGGKRIPLQRATRAFMDATWPTESQTQAPAPYATYYAIFSEQEPQTSDPSEAVPSASAALIAPTPDDAYVVEFTGTARPTPLSASTTTTFLSVYLPDLFLAATLIFGFGYQRDFGAAGVVSDPNAPMNWERQYETLKAGAAVEEARKKMLGGDFTAFPPNRIAAPPPPPQAVPQQPPSG